jgi:hypothetical protein
MFVSMLLPHDRGILLTDNFLNLKLSVQMASSFLGRMIMFQAW